MSFIFNPLYGEFDMTKLSKGGGGGGDPTPPPVPADKTGVLVAKMCNKVPLTLKPDPNFPPPPQGNGWLPLPFDKPDIWEIIDPHQLKPWQFYHGALLWSFPPSPSAPPSGNWGIPWLLAGESYIGAYNDGDILLQFNSQAYKGPKLPAHVYTQGAFSWPDNIYNPLSWQWPSGSPPNYPTPALTLALNGYAEWTSATVSVPVGKLVFWHMMPKG